MVTVREVAERAGVAPVTVSRVINGSSKVRPDTKRRVEQAIKELGFVPNLAARTLRSGTSGSVAVLVTDVTNPFFTTVVRGVEDIAHQRKLRVILCNTDENTAKEQDYLVTLLQQRIDGIILVSADSSGKHLIHVFDGLNPALVPPIVAVDRRLEGGLAKDTVVSNNRLGSKELTEHLLGHGHTRIALLLGLSKVSVAAERLAGYEEALRQQGLPIDDQLICHVPLTMAGGRAAVQTLLSLGAPPTAIYATNNFLAAGAMSALRERGIKVPEQMALVSFDDIEMAAAIDPFLTVMAQDAYNMGVTAMEMLHERLCDRGPATERQVVFQPRLIIRRSCGCRLPA
ncbi:MAG TPA: LacI family transcriptional regulator [Firmicutes bacterium]|nr:LacI family transcriptional regulator [Bacillota bacterium]